MIEVITTLFRRLRDNTRINFHFLIALPAYKNHMGGVERGDQLRGYTTKIRCRNLYKGIVIFLLVGVYLTNY